MGDNLFLIEKKIYVIRGQKGMLDKDLAILYCVRPLRLREQVKRNRKRFPSDFMFQLTRDEVATMVSQNAIPSWRHLGGYLPYFFTEQGVSMLSSVLRSERAVEVNINIMRTFVHLRQMVITHKDFALKLAELERASEKHDAHIQTIFQALRQLMTPPEKSRRRIGFQCD